MMKFDEDDEINQEVPGQNTEPTHCSGSARPSVPISPSNKELHRPLSDGSLDSNWQGTFRSVRERNAVMFNNDLMADVHFKVGPPSSCPAVIPGHKYVLATGSSVFYAMFYGGLANPHRDGPIEIPDVEPCAFLNLLRYLYCDAVELEADTVLATLYAAKKYLVPHLAKECVRFLETSLTARNACILLCQSRLFEETELMRRCWEVIDVQAEESLKSDGFVDIDYHTLKMILARETLNVKEVSVFAAAVRWAKAECVRRDLMPDAENQRKVMEEALYLIRIPTMTVEEYADGAAQSGILTLQETKDIFLNFTAKKKPILAFMNRCRRGLQPHRCHRFQSCANRSNQWRYRGRCDSIQFSVDRRIFIAGYGVYGSSNRPSAYKARIELKHNNVVLGNHHRKFMADGSSNTFAVYFETPIQIEPDTFYTASITLDGSELSYFGQEGLPDVTEGMVTFQFQCSSESTNGTGVQGGQIPELIYYC